MPSSSDEPVPLLQSPMAATVADEPQRRMSLMDRVNALYATLVFRIYLISFRWVCWARQRLLRWVTPATTRVAVLIGDGIAEGVGDSYSYAGLGHRIQSLFDGSRQHTKLTMGWRVYNLGMLHKRPEDWLPGTSALEQLVRGPYAKAAVVAYVVGNIGTDGPARIARTAEAAARLGKHVIVCAFGALENPGTVEHARGLVKIRQMREEINQASSRLQGCQGAGTISADVNVEKVLMGETLRTENNITTFNSFGYRRLSRELFDQMALAAKKVEWAHWKNILK